MNIRSYIFISFFLFACTNKKVDSKRVPSILVKKEKIKDAIIKKENTLLIVTHDYDYELNYYGIILHEYLLKDTVLSSSKRAISFGPYKDVLMGGKYSSAGANYPVQVNFNENKVFMSIYKADEMEGIFDYNKILEYNVKNDSIKEIVSFSDYFNSWSLSTYNNKIYGFDHTSKAFISISLNNLEIDTLYVSNSSFDEIEYHYNKNQFLDIIAFNRENGVIKFNIDFVTNKLNKTILYPLKSFSSYRKGIAIGTYKDFSSNTEELTLYNGSNKKSVPFDFKNFNTHWINDSEFLVIKQDEIQKIDTNLEVVDVFKREKIHIIDVTTDFILISYFMENEEKVGLLDFDFKKIIDIPNILPEDIVLIKDN
ncbi:MULTISPECIES: hypothetical protein [unclassified Polaribacter]|uniref:hypothetical protein n=1 Tax=unclassified Polaribacter TaxID=196858 RepID=UPI0011BDFC57|nr:MULTISPECIES: hypothetical protein [unclassified Polaribacter]TXD50623.1 hypothetical protein ES043_15380 [Polaribacter sp. IC063]TXD57286.1 hypothetical protein ES044_15400 [Polaribacter sp. IC066]